MKNREMLFIYNPKAGQGKIKSKLAEVIDIFVKAGYDVVVKPTQYSGDCYDTVLNYRFPYDILVCCGGDGTLDQTVAGMIQREDRIPIGYIPTGTTNDFAASLHIPKQIIKAANQLVEGYPFPVDIGMLGDRVFVYVAAFGLFTDVSYETNQQMKNLMGRAAYLLEGVNRISKVPKYHVKVSYDDQVLEEEVILGMVTNSRSVGGFKNLINSKVVFDDGKFEVTLVRRPKDLIELQLLLNNLLAKKPDKNIIQFSASSVLFEFDEEISWTSDGEYGGTYSKVEVRNLKKALKILVDGKHLPSISENPDDLNRMT